MSYTQILYHIILATDAHAPCLVGPNRLRFYNVISDVIEIKQCRLIRINAVKEHIHVLCSLDPSISLIDLVNDIKNSSTDFIKKENLFPGFTCWQEEYGAFTHSYKEKTEMSKYVERQQTYHREVTFDEEYQAMLKAAGFHQIPKQL